MRAAGLHRLETLETQTRNAQTRAERAGRRAGGVKAATNPSFRIKKEWLESEPPSPENLDVCPEPALSEKRRLHGVYGCTASIWGMLACLQLAKILFFFF